MKHKSYLNKTIKQKVWLVPGLAASASPGDLLVMQILGPSEAETLGVGLASWGLTNSLQQIAMEDQV